jgi:hypothetical protein
MWKAKVFGVFEDATDTGWFYLYDSGERQILSLTHIYNSQDVAVSAEDLDVIWDAQRYHLRLGGFGDSEHSLALPMIQLCERGY